MPARNCSTYFGYPAEIDTEYHRLCIDHIFVNDKFDVMLFDIIIDGEVQKASDLVPFYAVIALK